MPRILVALQVVLAAAIVLSARPSGQHLHGLAISACGVALGVWAVVAMGPSRVSVMPELRSNAKLVMSGPYRWVRHPMYAALLIACFGLSLAPFAYWKLGAVVILAGVLNSKANMEERELRGRFPEYASYAARTSRLLPFIW